MKLEPLELCALRLIFGGNDRLSEEVLERIEGATVLQRDDSGVGFFLTIQLPKPISEVPEVSLREFNFIHPLFPNGGSFMCWFEGGGRLEIEAVTFGGTAWPKQLDLSEFSELI